jgi:hypothetical protein
MRKEAQAFLKSSRATKAGDCLFRDHYYPSLTHFKTRQMTRVVARHALPAPCENAGA